MQPVLTPLPRAGVDVSIIVVNYNGEQFLRPCIESILASSTQYGYEILLIDNASADGSIEALAPFLNQLTLIRNPQNVGFTVANNQGLANASGRFVLLLNTDTLVSPNTIDVLVEYGKAHPEAGAVSPRLRNKDGSVQIPGNPMRKGPYQKSTPSEVDFISGAAFFTTLDMMKTIGGLDEAFFFYNDDIDLCIRIKKTGTKIIQLPNGDVLHYGGGSSHFDFKRLNYEGIRGGLYLVKKHYPKIAFYLYRILLLLFASGMVIGSWVLFKPRSSGTFVKLIKAIIKNDLKNIPNNPR